MNRIQLTITLKVFTLLASLLAVASVSAQEKGSHNFEIGGGINAYGTLGAVGGPTRYTGPGAYVEYRYGIADHFDIGGQLHYKTGKGESNQSESTSPTRKMLFNQFGLMAVADYNICPSRTIRPYIGAGAGFGTLAESYTEGSKNSQSFYHGILATRIGVQVWHFRLAWEVDFALLTYHATANAINLSFVF